MSRCYPYQPTVTVRNGVSGQPLIGTIKLHCESKTELLIEKKKERKEKRKERKEEKEKLYGFCDGKVKKLHNEKRYGDEKNRGLLVGSLLKGSEDEEAERLDKSDLTDEHDEPVCYLSDGTQTSNKRKRQPSPCITTSAVPSTTSSITVRDNIIRIRLSSQKHSKTDACLSNGQYCSIANKNGSPILDSVRKESILQIGDKPAVNVKALYENKVAESIAQVGGKPAGNGNTLYKNKVQRTKLFYESLIEDWVPPPFQSVLDEVDDEEWLFGTDQLKRLRAGKDFSGVLSCRQNYIMWPCERHLPEADIYALPYTIPY